MTKANDNLREVLYGIKELPASSKDKQIGVWNAISKNTLQDDLGRFSDSQNYDYDLDDATRDRLIAHTRQDTALNYNVNRSILKAVNTARLYSLFAMLFAFIGMVVSALNHL